MAASDAAPPAPRGKPQGTIKTLTGMRGIAAMHVVLFHGCTYFSREQYSIPTLVINASLSVPLFYVLSGFVLTVVANRDGGLTCFYTKRFARLAPVYWLSLLAYMAHPGLLEIFLDGRDGTNHFTYRRWQMALATLLTPLGLQTWVPFVPLWFIWNGPSWSVRTKPFST